MAELALSDVEEQANTSQESVEVRSVCEDLKNAATVENISEIISRREVDYNKVDDYLFKEYPPKALVGLTIEKAFASWPGNKEEVIALLKTQIEKGADLTRALAIESRKDSRGHLKILLEIIFLESILASEADTENIKKLNLEEIADKAANDSSFLWAIDGLYKYFNINNNNPVPAAASDEYKTLEVLRKKLQFHKIETNEYFCSLKWLLETCQLLKLEKGLNISLRRTRTSGRNGYEEIPGREELNVNADDIFLATLQLVSDIKDEIPATDSYLKTEYQELSEKAEKFAVALLDEVQDERELSTVIKMEDKFSDGVDDVFEDRLTWMREGIERVSLIQHAINLRCKAFVVSKNCQHLLKEVVFGRKIYRFWDDPRIKTGTGMPPLGILLMKVFLSLLCAAFMTLSVPLYCVCSPLVNLCTRNRCIKRFCELYDRPCQKYLLELWWFIGFLTLVIITSSEENFNEKDLSSGLTMPDIFLFLFVVAFCLRILTSFLLRIQTLCTIPRYRRNWRLLLPDVLTVVECASLLCFAIAFSQWIIRWHKLDGWRPSDDTFETDDVFYSLGSLLCFFKLAHYLKAEYALGTLNLSLYMMITKDVIYFAIIFVLLLFVPFATALKKIYSYYVVDTMKNATQPLARYSKVYDDLLWIMLGSDEKTEIEIEDSKYAYIRTFGELCFAVFTIAAVVVAFNMLIATMNHTYEDIMQNLDKEYVFSRTRMWMEYIATDRSALPPPLNLADIIKCCCKCFSKARKETPRKDEGIQKKRNERISIIKRLVFRYLRRSLMLDDNTECLQGPGVLSQTSRDKEHDVNPNHSIQEVTV